MNGGRACAIDDYVGMSGTTSRTGLPYIRHGTAGSIGSIFHHPTLCAGHVARTESRYYE